MNASPPFDSQELGLGDQGNAASPLKVARGLAGQRQVLPETVRFTVFASL